MFTFESKYKRVSTKHDECNDYSDKENGDVEK